MSKKASSNKNLYYASWPTAWGPMGAVASAVGVSRIILPHYQPKDLLDLLAWENQSAERNDEPFELLVKLSRRYFNAKPVDFGPVVCDMPAEGVFAGKVLRACREIPFGRTMSYGQLAIKIGQPDAARAVAGALGKNAVPLVVPCHRVTYADGQPGGFSAEGGVPMKQKMLAAEAAAV